MKDSGGFDHEPPPFPDNDNEEEQEEEDLFAPRAITSHPAASARSAGTSAKTKPAGKSAPGATATARPSAGLFDDDEDDLFATSIQPKKPQAPEVVKESKK